MRYTTLSGIAALATIVVNGVSTVPAVAAPGISVPCDTTALINALATAPAGSTLVLARHCTYHLTTAYAGADGLPPHRQAAHHRGPRLHDRPRRPDSRCLPHLPRHLHR